MTTERVKFRLFVMPCCANQLCWVNPRLPTHCPECGERVLLRLRSGEHTVILDDEATLRYVTDKFTVEAPPGSDKLPIRPLAEVNDAGNSTKEDVAKMVEELLLDALPTLGLDPWEKLVDQVVDQIPIAVKANVLAKYNKGMREVAAAKFNKEMQTEVKEKLPAIPLSYFRDADPSPWCTGCGAMTKEKCSCGEIADNN
jgi:hypothetical protein